MNIVVYIFFVIATEAAQRIACVAHVIVFATLPMNSNYVKVCVIIDVR